MLAHESTVLEVRCHCSSYFLTSSRLHYSHDSHRIVSITTKIFRRQPLVNYFATNPHRSDRFVHVCCVNLCSGYFINKLQPLYCRWLHHLLWNGAAATAPHGTHTAKRITSTAITASHPAEGQSGNKCKLCFAPPRSASHPRENRARWGSGPENRQNPCFFIRFLGFLAI